MEEKKRVRNEKTGRGRRQRRFRDGEERSVCVWGGGGGGGGGDTAIGREGVGRVQKTGTHVHRMPVSLLQGKEILVECCYMYLWSSNRTRYDVVLYCIYNVRPPYDVCLVCMNFDSTKLKVKGRVSESGERAWVQD